MEPPVATDSESIRDEKVKVLKAIPTLNETALIARPISRLPQRERGALRNRRWKRFAALKLEISSWRWHGVPFYIRAGKCMPRTCTEVLARFRTPPSPIRARGPASESSAFPHQPGGGDRDGRDGDGRRGEMVGRPAEMLGSQQPRPDEMAAYERVLGDAMNGEATLFAREDYVEQAWRIVDPVLKLRTPVYEYEPNSWGPPQANQIAPPGVARSLV